MAGLMELMLELEPFDASKHKERDVGLGGPSTEYLATEYDLEGKPFNFPQIWWDVGGNPHKLTPQQAYERAIRYEQETGKRFPRFNSIDEAVGAAEGRSAGGGAVKGLLAQ